MKEAEEFTNQILTTKDLFARVNEIDEVGTVLEKKGTGLAEEAGGRVSQDFLEIWRKVAPKDSSGQIEYIKKLKSYLLNLPRVRIELAFNPSEDFVAKLGNFVKKASNKKAVLDFVVNPKVIAGARIEFNGVFKDYSYADKLNQILKEKAELV